MTLAFSIGVIKQVAVKNFNFRLSTALENNFCTCLLQECLPTDKKDESKNKSSH